MTDMAATKYGWNNPAPGTRLWRLHNHPETLSSEDAAKVALDLLAHIDAITAAATAGLHEHDWECMDGGHSNDLANCSECQHIRAILRGSE